MDMVHLVNETFQCLSMFNVDLWECMIEFMPVEGIFDCQERN